MLDYNVPLGEIFAVKRAAVFAMLDPMDDSFGSTFPNFHFLKIPFLSILVCELSASFNSVDDIANG